MRLNHNWKGIPSLELRPHLSLCPSPPLGVKRESLTELEHLLAHSTQNWSLVPVEQGFGDPVADLAHFRFFHAAGC
jgi:hypothetical protein